MLCLLLLLTVLLTIPRPVRQCLANILEIKSGEFVTFGIKLNQNKYKFGLNVYKLNSNWTKSICFGSLIWPGSSTKL